MLCNCHVHTKQKKLSAVPIKLSQVNAELMDWGTIPVFMEQSSKLLDLLRWQFSTQLKRKNKKNTMRTKYNLKTCPKNENVKSTYCGHVVLQQLCSSSAELSFTCSLCLRGCWGGRRWRVSLCIHRTLERTLRGINPLWVKGKSSIGD